MGHSSSIALGIALDGRVVPDPVAPPPPCRDAYDAGLFFTGDVGAERLPDADAAAAAFAAKTDAFLSGLIAFEAFAFDAVLPVNASQRRVYDAVCLPVVEAVLGGANGAVLAYGMTGSGKTY